MCKDVTLTRRVKQPDNSDYNDLFPRVPCNTASKQSLFDLITDPENILDVLTAPKYKKFQLSLGFHHDHRKENG